MYSKTEGGPVLGVRTAAMVSGIEDILLVVVVKVFVGGRVESTTRVISLILEVESEESRRMAGDEESMR